MLSFLQVSFCVQCTTLFSGQNVKTYIRCARSWQPLSQRSSAVTVSRL